jgi:uncharacterized protein YkwD
MLSTLVTCAALLACSSDPSPATESQSAKPAAAEPVAETQPRTQTVYRPQTEPQQAESASDKETAPKFEILAVEQSIVDNTNAQRARYGLPALAIDKNLMITARQHGSWMAAYRQLTHSRYGVAENIAMGQSSPQEVLRTWMNSSGHRANILGGYRRIGVAAYRTPEGTIYWCQQFMP